MGKYILSIDSGTTSTRAILFDHDCQIVAVSQQESHVFYPKPGWVEQDATEIWNCTYSVINEVMAKAKVDASDIDSIGITNQRETSILWDRKTGRPIYNAIVWQSRQTDEVCDEWRKRDLEPAIMEKTGLRIDPYFSASKIVWMFKHVEGAYEKAQKGELMFGTVDSWLVYKLSGQRVHITDVTNASRTLLFNIRKCEWEPELLKMFDIPASILPEIKPTSYEYTHTAKDLFGVEIPICSVVGDQQGALFGQKCFEMGSVKNTYGTGGFMLMNTGDQLVFSKSGLLSTVAWQIGDKVTYALEGSIFVSGSLLKWLRDQVHLFDNVGKTEEMALSVEDSAGVYIVPAFVGLGAPYWDDKCRGSIVGLTLGSNQNHIVRAALESMAYQSKDIVEAMEKDSDLHLTSVKVDGGAAVNNFLLQFQADILHCSIERYKISELTALGAGYLAGLATGYWSMDELNNEIDRIFVPERSQEEMVVKYAGWKKAIESCKTFK